MCACLGIRVCVSTTGVHRRAVFHFQRTSFFVGGVLYCRDHSHQSFHRQEAWQKVQAIQQRDAHRRIAVRIVLVFGKQPSTSRHRAHHRGQDGLYHCAVHRHRAPFGTACKTQSFAFLQSGNCSRRARILPYVHDGRGRHLHGCGRCVASLRRDVLFADHVHRPIR